MNIATPQEQFESKKRLDAIFHKPAKPFAHIVPYCLGQAAVKASLPWPCYAERSIPVVLEKPVYFRVHDVHAIARIVGAHYKVGFADIMSSRRTKKIVLPRQIIMYLAKVTTHRSYPDIARRMNKDHTTILHGVRKIEQMMMESPALASEINLLRDKLEDGVV